MEKEEYHRIFELCCLMERTALTDAYRGMFQKRILENMLILFLQKAEASNEEMSRTDVDVICGMDLGRSIFAGCPGTFLGRGNCLVTAREGGKADVTYVNEDTSLTMPLPITYPSDPTVMESIIYLNSLPNNH